MHFRVLFRLRLHLKEFYFCSVCSCSLWWWWIVWWLSCVVWTLYCEVWGAELRQWRGVSASATLLYKAYWLISKSVVFSLSLVDVLFLWCFKVSINVAYMMEQMHIRARATLHSTTLICMARYSFISLYCSVWYIWELRAQRRISWT